MIARVVTKRRLNEPSSRQDELAYWLSRTPEERLATVESGRVRGKYGDVPVDYIGREQFIMNKKATRRKRDLADLEAMGQEECHWGLSRPVLKRSRPFTRIEMDTDSGTLPECRWLCNDARSAETIHEWQRKDNTRMSL